MTKHIQLIIPEPCHESWDKMTPVEQGKFCASCQKKVIDFTGMSDEKLAAFFRKPDISVCGRFREDQLGIDLAMPKKRIPWVKYFFQIALPAVLFSYKGYSQYTKGKAMVKPVALLTEQQQVKLMGMNASSTTSQSQVLTSRVVDTEGNGISYASIWRENSSQGTAADSAGYFRLTVNEKDSLILLKISGIGYKTRNIYVDLKDEYNTPFIQLEKDDMIMGEVAVTAGIVVVAKKRTSVTMPKKNSMIIPAIMDSASGHFKIFPNPVASGSSLNIELTSKLKEGYYYLTVNSLDGKRVFQKEIWIDAEAKVMNIELPFITVGNYIVSLKNKKNGKVFGEKLVIR